MFSYSESDILIYFFTYCSISDFSEPSFISEINIIYICIIGYPLKIYVESYNMWCIRFVCCFLKRNCMTFVGTNPHKVPVHWKRLSQLQTSEKTFQKCPCHRDTHSLDTCWVVNRAWMKEHMWGTSGVTGAPENIYLRLKNTDQA